VPVGDTRKIAVASRETPVRLRRIRYSNPRRVNSYDIHDVAIALERALPPD
jgi:hypothetical protein